MSLELHCHTTASDGVLTPCQLLELAYENGLNTLAITDHDTVEGLKSAKERARSLGIELIPGVELSCYQECEIHVLGYFVDPDNSQLLATLSAMKKARRERIEKILSLLAEAGIKISWEQVEVHSQGGVLGRPHVARALVESGVVADIGEAFSAFLGEGKRAYVPHRLLTPREASSLIKRSGGIAVLAHPGLCGNDALIEKLLCEGYFDGIEVYHPAHTSKMTSKFRRLSKRLDLLLTGGSDFHRPGAVELGGVVVPADTLYNLKLAAGVLGS